MKINDKGLLQLIWTQQLKQLSTGVFHNYAGGQTAVVDSNWFESASDIHLVQRQVITNRIGRQQLLKRIRKLIKEENNPLSWAHKGLTFFICSGRSKDAFRAAREFMLQKGVPTGYVDGRANCTVIPNRADLSTECHLMLLDNFGEFSSELPIV